MSCSVLPLTFKLTPPCLHRPQFPSDPTTTSTSAAATVLPLLSNFLPHTPSKSFICFAFSPNSSSSSSNNGYEREEARWLREEQRWLREEQRWLREEQRWTEERDTFLREIQTLENKIQELERQNSLQQASLAEAVANIAKLLKVLKEGDLGKNINRIAESGSSAIPLVVDAAMKEEDVIVKEVVDIVDMQAKEEKKRKTLRKGSEGDDVQAMQEALQKLGFYSGEEDMEFSAFSSGTERAVKTWQASMGTPEDGIMTAELLERLFMEQKVGDSGLAAEKNPDNNSVTIPKKDPTNGAPVASISEIQQNVVKEEGVGEAEISQHRVFLLGENRWEEPSRLSGSKKQAVSKSRSSSSATKCLSCRGEGRLLCMECDGTGEPNIEPQFLEWVDEGTKCPYCEGHGYTTCDVCEGKGVAEA